MRLTGKTAVVTGASRGIGKAIALRLAREGAQTVLCARDADALNQDVKDFGSAGLAAAAIALDLRKPETPAQLAEFALRRFGAIDIVVNNAGATKRGEFENLSEDDWADGFALKFFGSVRLTRATWPHLKAASGSLIFISGVGGRTPGSQFTIGGSVNAALLSFTKAMAETGLRDGVQVNAEKQIELPAAERRYLEEHSIARIGEPEDIAALVAFIASPEGRLMHGSLVDIDAGATKTI
jgi:NAD(P)-dependent dehydrogenase (short-subunit alcohol dehydrogenase family)